MDGYACRQRSRLQECVSENGSRRQGTRKFNNNEYFGKWKEAYPDFIATDFNEAVTWILGGG